MDSKEKMSIESEELSDLKLFFQELSHVNNQYLEFKKFKKASKNSKKIKFSFFLEQLRSKKSAFTSSKEKVKKSKSLIGKRDLENFESSMDQERENSQNLREIIRARRSLRAQELKKELEELRSPKSNTQNKKIKTESSQRDLENETDQKSQKELFQKNESKKNQKESEKNQNFGQKKKLSNLEKKNEICETKEERKDCIEKLIIEKERENVDLGICKKQIRTSIEIPKSPNSVKFESSDIKMKSFQLRSDQKFNIPKKGDSTEKKKKLEREKMKQNLRNSEHQKLQSEILKRENNEVLRLNFISSLQGLNRQLVDFIQSIQNHKGILLLFFISFPCFSNLPFL